MDLRTFLSGFGDTLLRADGTVSSIPVVNNLTASRTLTVAALGIDDHRRCAAEFARVV